VTGTRFVHRRPDTELSADSRAKLAEILALFADPTVDDEQFLAIGPPYVEWLWHLPEVERLEACSILAEVAARAGVYCTHMAGDRVVGWSVPDLPVNQ
jgi:hypothetical protein